MDRTLYVLAFLMLQAGLTHPFSWDIVGLKDNRLDFYKEDKIIYSMTSYNNNLYRITYDQIHNRVLFTENHSSKSVLSFDLETGKTQTLIDFKLDFRSNYLVYEPGTGLLFVLSESSTIYSYLVKPGSNSEVDANPVIDLEEWCHDIAVDSCGGYIYWILGYSIIERVRFNGTDREVIIDRSDKSKESLTIDPQMQKMYWIEYEYHPNNFSIVSSDLNGRNRTTLYDGIKKYSQQLTVSKDFIYSAKSNDNYFWKFPKNPTSGTDLKSKEIEIDNTPTGHGYNYIIAYYTFEELTGGVPLCEALKHLLPKYSATNDSDLPNDSTDGSLFRINETVAFGDDKCDLFSCHNYCLQGDCTISVMGQPKCRCNAGFSGERCEVNACQAYCLNNGVCTLNEENNPECQCTKGYHGDRCDVPGFLKKCSQIVSILKD